MTYIKLVQYIFVVYDLRWKETQKSQLRDTFPNCWSTIEGATSLISGWSEWFGFLGVNDSGFSLSLENQKRHIGWDFSIQTPLPDPPLEVDAPPPPNLCITSDLCRLVNERERERERERES